MERRRGRPRRRPRAGPPSTIPPPPIYVGNCTVEVGGSSVTCERQTDDCVLISTMGPANIRHLYGLKSSCRGLPSFIREESFLVKDCSFQMLNPKDIDSRSRTLVQEVLNIYMKELPSMNYAANTGKRSTFLEKCVSGGKYKTMVLRTDSTKENGEVIAAISFQIIASDALYSEIPLAAVCSEHQRKGIGQLLYSELRKRLQSVGIFTIFCWADKESKGFWAKQGFTSIGDVDGKGRVRRLPVRASVRKALCFPGDSTLMVSQLKKDVVQPGILNKSIILSLSCLTPCATKLLGHTNMVPGVTDLDIAENIHNDGEKSRSSPGKGEKRCLWEASLSSLKSKRIKGCHLTDCGISSDWCSAGEHDAGDAVLVDSSHDASECQPLLDALTKDAVYPDLAFRNEVVEVQTGASTDFVNNNVVQDKREPKIFFMNISDENKKTWLRKIVEELGGSVTSDGWFCTHVITGKACRTRNFCTALCSGAWVVSSSWLKESYREKRFVGESGFILEDEHYMSKYKSTLRDAVIKARANPRSLLKGYSVCLGKHVQPPANVLSIIINSAGGHVIRGVLNTLEPSKTIFIACEEDMEDALLAAKKGIWTFSSDWFMSCIMRQELDFDSPQFSESL
ncbi:unnamed protein product [Spirodela intermedia]|uniref:Uncharacterized protein n=1 Tax=Spirodela intermedia TaxID=51605 RepID=A0A7I8JX46_SPIIN|nr:unnamed protein product [Spirodela intermedia]